MIKGEKTWALGIETSCDDTSVAFVNGEGAVLYQVMASQIQGHLPFGGVVPEVASRLHAESLLPLIDRAVSDTGVSLQDVKLIAVSSRPGLIGSLLVGVVTAKTLSMTLGKPLAGVNHIHGHIFSPFLHGVDESGPNVQFPYLSLVVSGGHTHLYLVKSFTEIQELGRTRDDAAGEAYDKFANLLRLGFPGGPLVDRMASGGNPKAFQFPRSLKNEDFEFSFSGLKAAAMRLIESLPKPITIEIQEDLCASFQEAVCEVLIHQLSKAVDRFGIKRISISGGVSANSRLREWAGALAREKGLELFIPPMKYCTDNASMIAFTGLKQFEAGVATDQTLTPSSSALDRDYL